MTWTSAQYWALGLGLLGVGGCDYANPLFERWETPPLTIVSCYETTPHFNFDTVATVTTNNGWTFNLKDAYYFCRSDQESFRVAHFSTGDYGCVHGECRKILSRLKPVLKEHP